jgi:hypothetical protein
MGLAKFGSWRSFFLNRKGLKAVNIFLGFFLIINFRLGSGYLGIPFAFFYSGYLAAVPTTLFIAAVNWINANYLLEVMARAQVSQYLCAKSRYHYPTTTTTTTLPLLYHHHAITITKYHYHHVIINTTVTIHFSLSVIPMLLCICMKLQSFTAP